jgi:hypothetical protein
MIIALVELQLAPITGETLPDRVPFGYFKTIPDTSDRPHRHLGS